MNVDFLLVFLLAHFFGDFVFQTNKIARMKEENLRGVLYHSSIVLLFQVVFLSVYGIRGILAGVLSAITHVAFDAVKLVLGKKIRKITLLYFFVDQCLHIAVILLLTDAFHPAFTLPSTVSFLVKCALFLIIFTYITTILCKMLLRDCFVSIRSTAFFWKRERIQDGLFSVLVFLGTALQALPPLLVMLLAIPTYILTQRRQYPYALSVLCIKCGFYSVLSFLGSILFLHLL